MVNKRQSKITRKPGQPNPKEVEQLLNGLGTDPETSEQVDTEPSESKGKAYPHRLSADFDAAQYKRLKWASFDTGEPMTNILRDAVEDWLKARGY
jgi:hypothetical protein